MVFIIILEFYPDVWIYFDKKYNKLSIKAPHREMFVYFPD